MTVPTTTRWRFFRAGVFALLASQLAVLGHVLGGGTLPDPAVLITVGVFLGGSLSGLATRRRTGPQIFAVLVLSQLAFHVAFQATARHADHLGIGGGENSGRMLVFHLVAALATSWLLAGGESALFRLCAALRRVLRPRRRHAVVELALQWTAVLHREDGGVRLRAGELSPISRRGPPLTA